MTDPSNSGGVAAASPGSELCPSPVFVLTASRSGSTLLRFILDTHPDLACPPETNLVAACARLIRAGGVLENATIEGAPGIESAEPPPLALTVVRDAVDRMYGDYLRRRGKRRWVEKSLDSYQNAELMTRLYPRARFICLYRHCMDVIASGVEACPWGLHSYGFDPFVAQYPGNSVAAVGNYWLSTVRAIMEFEEKHPDSCHRVRYEDLVSEPETCTAAILAFLGAEPAPGITEECFRSPHEVNGSSDGKIWFTREVTSDSIGRGLRVPAARLPPNLRREINKVLAKLDYRLVDDEWNATVGRADPRADRDSPPTAGSPESDGRRQAIRTAIAEISGRIASWSADDLSTVSARWPALAGRTLAVVVREADGEHEEFRWNFGVVPAATVGDAADLDEQPAATIIASPSVWKALLDQQTNMVTEMTAGRLRCVSRWDRQRTRTNEIQAVAELLGLAQVPLARTSGELPDGRQQPARRSAGEQQRQRADARGVRTAVELGRGVGIGPHPGEAFVEDA